MSSSSHPSGRARQLTQALAWNVQPIIFILLDQCTRQSLLLKQYLSWQAAAVACAWAARRQSRCAPARAQPTGTSASSQEQSSLQCARQHRLGPTRQPTRQGAEYSSNITGHARPSQMRGAEHAPEGGAAV